MYKVLLSLLLVLPVFSGCSGVQTFPNVVRAGETTAVGMGWQKKFKRSNTTVTIIPSSGEPVVYQPDNPAVRAIINLYPDPVSWIVVGTETQQDSIYSYGYSYGTVINTNFTNGDQDWWQTTAFVDLPDTLPSGIATIQLMNDVGETVSSTVEIVNGAGLADVFNASNNGGLTNSQLASLERSPYFEVLFNGAVIPYAIELEFSYLGKIHVVNPRASIKNVIWSGNGSTLKVMLLPAKKEPLNNFLDFKFYIAGEGAMQFVQDIQPLILQTMHAFDINGNPVSGLNISINANIN